MNLDINTEKGRVAAQDELDAFDILMSNNDGIAVYHTSTTGGSPVDGIICCKTTNKIIGIAEVKSRRDMDREKFVNERRSEWLVTKAKIDAIASISKLLQIAAFGILYLPIDGLIFVVKITRESGDVCCKLRTEVTQTKATTNGGIANRLNAFICMKSAKVMKMKFNL